MFTVAIELDLQAPPREPIGLLDDLLVTAAPGAPNHRFDPEEPTALTALGDFVVRGVHDTGPGFTVTVRDAEGAAIVLSAVVAALTGGDIAAAAEQPDLARIAALNPMAHDALRERLAHLVTADPAAVAARLRDWGLG